MGSRSKRSERCSRCRMHLHLCICRSIPSFPLKTRVVLVMHYRENIKTTATGPLALEALPNSEIRIHGHQDHPLDFSDLNTPERRTLFLYPGNDAPVLTRGFLEQDSRPVTLVVPDGSWRQAAKMRRRLPGLEHAEMVRLPPGPETSWGIRNEPHPAGLATLEAIARALGIMESPAVQTGLEDLFRLMVARTLLTRGDRSGGIDTNLVLG
ncbi:tRNA-uridine aminocarboxypropyltransferase [Geobacter sp. DSM 9736]|uniref:tRNA-uridine aminocarboxypropyltransferase n=1 Tax=Geobacter sp. DSM 9736 TaxID=1277350 RepID=UPI000B512410|nr:tRNA-uridine aminocarboxypropyltransferase [Geobacter sp. DSM 9736]SNB47116.1 DTW domain-containing protein YfiP [Geobacter sp. DSM 9736]